MKKLLFLIPVLFLFAGSTVHIQSYESVSYELVSTTEHTQSIHSDIHNSVDFESEYLISKKVTVAYKLHVSIGQEVKAQTRGVIAASIGVNRSQALAPDFVPLIFDIGQSNSVGRAEADRQNQLTQYPESPARSLIYFKPDYASTDNGAFQNMFAGSANTREPDQSTSLRMFGAYHPLSALIASGFQRNCYVVMAGDGGTGLKKFLTSPDWDPSSVGGCFQHALSFYYTVAYAKIQAAEPGKTIVPIIVWHQGEADAADVTATSQYAANFNNFVSALRASHASLSNALLFITKLNYAQTAGETTINGVFDAYQAAHPYNTRIIDISDKPRKIDLTTGEKGGITATAGDDTHSSYIAQNAKGERIYSSFVSYYQQLSPLSEQLDNTVFNPSTLTSTGVRLQFNKANSTLGTYYDFTGLTNNLSTGTFSTFVGTPAPLYKFDYGYKGWITFIPGATARVASSTAIGTTLFANSTGFSFAAWLKPRDGQTTSQTIFHDIQNTAASTNSRIGFTIATDGKINIFISISGTTVQATTANVIFADGIQTAPTHVAATFTQGGLIKIYVNGTLQTLDVTNNGNISALTLANYVNATNPLQIGAVKTGASTYVNYYFGMIRELTIQPGVIYSTTDISNLMTN